MFMKKALKLTRRVFVTGYTAGRFKLRRALREGCYSFFYQFQGLYETIQVKSKLFDSKRVFEDFNATYIAYRVYLNYVSCSVSIGKYSDITTTRSYNKAENLFDRAWVHNVTICTLIFAQLSAITHCSLKAPNIASSFSK